MIIMLMVLVLFFLSIIISAVPLKTAALSFNMIIKKQSQLNNDFTVYLPVTLLNQYKMNMEEKYKTFAMKYLNI